MPEELQIKAGDTHPVFEVSLSGGQQNYPINLGNTSEVRFYMEQVVENNPNELVINQPASSIDSASSKVSYDFEDGGTAESGEYRAEFVLIYGDGTQQTLPRQGYYSITINEPIDKTEEVQSPAPEDIEVGTVTASHVTTGSATIQSASIGEVSVGSGPYFDSFTGTNLSEVGGSLTASPEDVTSVDNAHITPASVTTDETNTDEISVSDSTAVTGGPVGDGGDLVPLTSGIIQSRATTTSTTYSDVIPNGDRVVLDCDKYSAITNISDLHISATGIVQQNTSGESVSVVVKTGGSHESASEVTVAGTSFTRYGTDAVALGSPSGLLGINMDMKVSGGEGWLFNRPKITLWGEIQ